MALLSYRNRVPIALQGLAKCGFSRLGQVLDVAILELELLPLRPVLSFLPSVERPAHYGKALASDPYQETMGATLKNCRHSLLALSQFVTAIMRDFIETKQEH